MFVLRFACSQNLFSKFCRPRRKLAVHIYPTKQCDAAPAPTPASAPASAVETGAGEKAPAPQPALPPQEEVADLDAFKAGCSCYPMLIGACDLPPVGSSFGIKPAPESTVEAGAAPGVGKAGEAAAGVAPGAAGKGRKGAAGGKQGGVRGQGAKAVGNAGGKGAGGGRGSGKAGAEGGAGEVAAKRVTRSANGASPVAQKAQAGAGKGKEAKGGRKRGRDV